MLDTVSITELNQLGNENLIEDTLETITGTGEVLHDYSSTGRERPWGRHKMGNERLYKLYERARELDPLIMSDSRMESLQSCASSLLYKLADNGKRKLIQANFCRVRLCPMCNWRKSLKMFSQVSKITDAIMERQDGTRFIFLTLTVKNVEGADLSKELDRINQGFSYMVAKSRNFAPAKGLKEHLLGYLKAVEITFNAKQNTYHPHIHAILEVDSTYFDSKNYLGRVRWAKLWQEAIKADYIPSVDVRAIDTTSKAVAEVAKYPMKMDVVLKNRDEEKAVNAVITLHRSTYKRRLVTFGGDMAEVKRQLSLDDVEKGDLTHVETDNEKGFNAVAKILFQYKAGQGVYIC